MSRKSMQASQSSPRQVAWQEPAGRLLLLAMGFEHLAQINVGSYTSVKQNVVVVYPSVRPGWLNG